MDKLPFLDNLDGLNASRKADRERIAAALVGIATKHGATVERRDEPRHVGWCGAGIHLHFALNGVGAMTTINDLHGGDHALISWFNDYSSARGHKCRDFASTFNSAVKDYSHPRPHHKATSCPGSWFDLARCLDGGLSTAAKGEAFRPIDEPAAT